MKQPVLIIYHANCLDGFTAAYVTARYIAAKRSCSLTDLTTNKLIELIPANYGDQMPDVTGRTVYMVDFSVPRAKLVEMAGVADHITVFDHHKTAAADLQGLDIPNCRIVFDMARSGAGIAFDELFPRERRTSLVNFVEDRDLWRFWFTETRALANVMFSTPMTLVEWDRLAFGVSYDRPRLVEAGEAIERWRIKTIEDLLAATRRTVSLAGWEIPCANVPPMFASDAGHIMAKDAAFAATFYINKDGRYCYSLRARKEVVDAGNVDVSEVAKLFGGGGHAAAAGFTAPAAVHHVMLDPAVAK